MTVAPSAAAAAYQAVAKIGAESAAQTGSSASAAGSTDFSQFLSQAMDNAVSTMRTGEQMAAKQATGQTDVVSVVNAVNNAELTLDTVVAIRDKVISAYQNIMQMPI
jgi:flagellar hook-basal body complex protein FliE